MLGGARRRQDAGRRPSGCAAWRSACRRSRTGRWRRIALVGETFADVREVMIEGRSSGLLTLHENFDRPTWQPARRRIEWKNGTIAQAFSSEDPEGLRGPQFSAAWSDGVGHTAAAGEPKPRAA
ncbi:MAG: terminase family protein [Bauldia sp.]